MIDYDQELNMVFIIECSTGLFGTLSLGLKGLQIKIVKLPFAGKTEPQLTDYSVAS